MTLEQYAAIQPRLVEKMNDEIAIRLSVLIVEKIREWGDTILYDPINQEDVEEYLEEISSPEFDKLTMGNGSILVEEFNKKLKQKRTTESKAVS